MPYHQLNTVLGRRFGVNADRTNTDKKPVLVFVFISVYTYQLSNVQNTYVLYQDIINIACEWAAILGRTCRESVHQERRSDRQQE